MGVANLFPQSKAHIKSIFVLSDKIQRQQHLKLKKIMKEIKKTQKMFPNSMMILPKKRKNTNSHPIVLLFSLGLYVWGVRVNHETIPFCFSLLLWLTFLLVCLCLSGVDQRNATQFSAFAFFPFTRALRAIFVVNFPVTGENTHTNMKFFLLFCCVLQIHWFFLALFVCLSVLSNIALQ